MTEPARVVGRTYRIDGVYDSASQTLELTVVPVQQQFSEHEKLIITSAVALVGLMGTETLCEGVKLRFRLERVETKFEAGDVIRKIALTADLRLFESHWDVHCDLYNSRLRTA